MKEDYVPRFIGYRNFFKNRAGRGGGIAILVHDDIIAQEKDILPFVGGKLEIQAVVIHTSQGKIDIVNIYNPNQIVTEVEFRHYMSQLDDKAIMIGDFNAHHTLWEPTIERACGTGRNLVNSLLQYPLQILTYQSMPTYLNYATGNTSTIDLCFTTSNLFPLSSIELGEDCGSDHCPIHVEIQIKPNEAKIKSRKKWKFNDKWEEYQGKIVEKMDINEQWNTEEINTHIINVIVETGKEIFGQTTGEVNMKYNKTWWTKKCQIAVNARKIAKRRLIQNPTPENADNMRRLEDVAKRTIKEAKERKWKEYVDSINSKSPIGTVWKKIKQIKSSYKPLNSPILDNNVLITNSKEKAECFAEYFESIFKLGDNNDANTASQEIGDQNVGYNREISIHELQRTLQNLKGNSPGIDDVHNNMLKRLPTPIIEVLLQFFNKIWRTSELPQQWKKALIIPIHKFGKSERITSSYRPISLLPCIGKVLERIVMKRLYWYLESERKLSSGQSGFRSRCNTLDQIARIEKVIREAFVEKKVVIVIFIDLKGAYDSVDHKILIHKLKNIGVKGNLLGYCKNFLHGRTFRIMYNGEVSNEKVTNIGVPQGAAISPILFNVYISDIPIMENVIRCEYADDIALVTKGDTIEECTVVMQEALNRLYEYTENNKLSINYQKTVGMYFTRKKIEPLPLNINLYNVNFTNEYKYLGMTLDSPYLNYNKHINKLRAECLSRLNIIKAIANNNWGADREMVLRVYDSILLSKINYGAEFYSTASNNTLNALDTIQNTALRLIVGAKQSTPITSLQVEANRPPLYLQREKSILEYFNRIRHMDDSIKVVRELFENILEQKNKPWSNTTQPPLLIRGLQLIEKYKLEILDCADIPLHTLRPPWMEYQEIQYFMEAEDVKSLPDDVVRGVFREKNNKYSIYKEIYTDGSKSKQGTINNTSAAMCIPGDNITKQWKLPDLSIMSAELYAIAMALEWVGEDEDTQNAVVYTDSLSSIYLLRNNSNNNNINKFIIQLHLNSIMQKGKEVAICWIPSHRGIPGNDKADIAAKQAINENFITIPNISRDDGKMYIRKNICTAWKQYWHNKVNETNIGRHMRTIRENVSYWPWTSIPKNRRQETCLARLRLGHTGLADNQHRMGMVASPLCECGQNETVKHYLMECTQYRDERRKLQQILANNGIDFNMSNILGGGNYSVSTQRHIMDETWRYVIDTQKATII